MSRMTPLRRIRSERNMSQDDVIRRVPQVSATTIRAMDRGDHIPAGRTLLHVSRGLGVSVSDLLEGAEVTSRTGKVGPKIRA